MFSSIIDNDSRIHDNCSLETGTVLGPGVVVEDDAILSGVHIWPGMTVQQGKHVKSDMIDQ